MLLTVLGLGLAGALFVAGVSRYSQALNRQKIDSTDILRYRSFLTSAMELVKFGVRNKWCLTNALLQEPVPSDCNWSHARNTERLLLSDEAIEHINAPQIAAGTMSATDRSLRLNSLDFDVSTSDFLVDHPLQYQLRIFPRFLLPVHLHVHLERMDNVNLPRSGNEVYVKIRLSLNVPMNFGGWKVAGRELYQEAVIAYYPREIGSFALMVPASLHLESNSPPSTGASGDVYLPMISNAPSFRMNGSAPRGAIFESPIFVNNDIILPPRSGSQGFAPVQFRDVVYVGQGGVQEKISNAEVPFWQNTGGANEEKFFAQSANFGGFLRGISMDGTADLGLNYLFGLSIPATVTDYNLAQKCNTRREQFGNLQKTVDSGLVARQQSATLTDDANKGHVWNYHLALTGGNRFLMQEYQWKGAYGDSMFEAAEDPGDNRYVDLPVPQPSPPNRPSTGPILRVDIEVPVPPNYRENATEKPEGCYHDHEPDCFGPWHYSARSRWYHIEMGFDTKSTLTLYVDSAYYNDQKTKVIASASSANAALASATASESTAHQECDAANAANAPDKTQKCAAWQSALQAKNDAAAAAAAANLISNPASYIDQLINDPTRRPKIIVQTNSYLVNGSDANGAGAPNPTTGLRQPNRVNFTVKFVNEDKFPAPILDSNLQAYAPRIYVYARDLGSDLEGGSLRHPAGGNDSTNTNWSLTGVFRFKRDASGNRRMVVDWPQWPAPPSTASYPGPWYAVLEGEPASSTYNTLEYSWSWWGTQRNFKQPVTNLAGLGEIPSDVYNLVADVDVPCDNSGVVGGSATGTAAWQSFKEFARSAWNFTAPPGPFHLTPSDTPNTQEVTLVNSTKFEVHSVVQTCKIAPGTTFFAGFLTCDHLIFEGGRTQPLEIVGTILAKKITWNNVIQQGLHWSSIYSPQALTQLRAHRVLNRGDGSSCSTLPDQPFWHPEPGFTVANDQYLCSAAYLRRMADAISWTAVDPDCANPGGAMTHNACKRQVVNYMTKEISRKGNI